MFLRTLILLMLLDISTPASEPTLGTTTPETLNGIPLGSFNSTERDINNETQGGTSTFLDESAKAAEEVVLNAQDDPTYAGLVSHLKIHHCHCPGNHVLTQSGCRPFNTSVTVLDSTKFSPRTIPTSQLAGYVKELHCDTGKMAVVLPDESFALLPGGLLLISSLGMFYSHDHYCVSHVYHQDEKMPTGKMDKVKLIEEKYVSWVAKVCIKHPIYKCCGKISSNTASENPGHLHVDQAGCNIQKNVSSLNDISLFFSTANDGLSLEGTESSRPSVMFGQHPVEWFYDHALPIHLNCPRGKGTFEQHFDNNKNVHLTYSRDGSILTWDVQENMHVEFWHTEFCLDRRGEEGNHKYFTMFCHSERKETSHRDNYLIPSYIRKCCSERTVYNVETQKCEIVHSDPMWIEHLYKNLQWDLLSGFYSNLVEDDSLRSTAGAYATSLIIGETNNSHYDPLEYEEPLIELARIPLMYGFPSCPWHDINITAENFKLLPDGSVEVSGDTIDTSLFCFETFTSSNDIEPPAPSVRTLVVCDLADSAGGACPWASALLVPLMGVSCVFMALTLLVFLLVPDLTDRVSSRCVVSEIVALLVSFLLLIVAHTWQSIYGTVYCVLLGTLSHSAALASFFWLNAICVEVWITIRRVNPEPRIQGHRRFIAYCVWGWGAPAAIGLLGALADALPSHHGLLRPQTAVACFPNKDNRAAHWAYVYAPMAALLCVNMCLFVHLSFKIVHTTRQAARMRARAPTEETSHYWNKMKTYLKLFLVMGVSWTAEVLSFQFKSCRVWIYTDSFNTLRGVFIFFIFVFKAEVLEKVRKNAKDRWSHITGRARQVLTAVRGRQNAHLRTFGKGLHSSGSSGTVTLSVLSPSVTPRPWQNNGTPATTPTSYTLVPPEFPTVNPPTPKHRANDVNLIKHDEFLIDESSAPSSDQNNENHQQTANLEPIERSSSATTLRSLRVSSVNGLLGSLQHSSPKVRPSDCVGAEEHMTVQCPVSELLPGRSATSKLLSSKSSPSLDHLHRTGLASWGGGGRMEASPR